MAASIPSGTAGIVVSSEGSSVTQHDVTLPASIVADDILLAIVFHDGNSTWTADTGNGWALLASGNISTVASMAVQWKRAAGGETATFITSSVAERSTHFGVRITGAHTTSAPEISVAATGASTTPNPASLTASWGAEDNLWIAFYGVDSGAPTAYPLADNQTSTGTTPTSAAYGGICAVNETTATKDVGTFTNSLSDDWRAYTVVVRPGAVVEPAFHPRVIWVPAPAMTRASRI